MYPKYTTFPFYKMYTESATTTGKRKTVHKCIKTKTKQDCLGTGAIRVFTDQACLTGNCVNSLLCTERYHDVILSLLGYSLNVFLKICTNRLNRDRLLNYRILWQYRTCWFSLYNFFVCGTVLSKHSKSCVFMALSICPKFKISQQYMVFKYCIRLFWVSFCVQYT